MIRVFRSHIAELNSFLHERAAAWKQGIVAERTPITNLEWSTEAFASYSKYLNANVSSLVTRLEFDILDCTF